MSLVLEGTKSTKLISQEERAPSGCKRHRLACQRPFPSPFLFQYEDTLQHLPVYSLYLCNIMTYLKTNLPIFNIHHYLYLKPPKPPQTFLTSCNIIFVKSDCYDLDD